MLNAKTKTLLLTAFLVIVLSVAVSVADVILVAVALGELKAQGHIVRKSRRHIVAEARSSRVGAVEPTVVQVPARVGCGTHAGALAAIAAVEA